MARKPNLIERLALRVASPFVEAAVGGTLDPDDYLYRRITDTKRDLIPFDLQRAQDISAHLWRSNPMARRLIEMIADFVVGDGFVFDATEDVVQDVIDTFWTDPVMQLDLRHRDLVRDQSIYGEIAFRKFVNEFSGRMRVGVIDNARIYDVQPDPNNVLVDKTLLLRTKAGIPESVDLVVYDDASTEDRMLDPQWIGDAFYFAINRLTGQHRGVPDLYALADWVDGYDQLLFNALERSGLSLAWLYDVTIDGADDGTIRKWEQDHREPPAPGSVRVHNEHEHWDTVSPKMNSDDVVTLGRAVKNMSLGGAGIPEAWFAEGDSANRATLTAQGDPTYRMLQTRQDTVAAMFKRIVTVAVQSQVGSKIPVGTDTTFRVITPDLSAKDLAGISSALPQVANALASAIDEELISRQSARSVFLTLAAQTGVDLDPQAEEDTIDGEREDERARDVERVRAMQSAMGAMGGFGAQNAPSPRGIDAGDSNDPQSSAKARRRSGGASDRS